MNTLDPATDTFSQRFGEGDSLPKIFCFLNGGSGDWLSMSALSEDGEFLAGHVCSHVSFGPHDLGFGTDGWKHEYYRDRYPDGFELVWVPNARNHAGLSAAHAKHIVAGEPGTPWQQERAAAAKAKATPYAVHFLTDLHADKSRFSTFPEALAFYREHDGYALRNEERVGDDDHFSGLTAEQKEELIP